MQFPWVHGPNQMKFFSLKTAITTLASIAAVVVFFWGVEDRYVNAADLKAYEQRQQQRLEVYQQQQQKTVTDFRRQMLEDELFELELKVEEGTAGRIDRAKKARIQRQLERLQ